MLISIDNGVTFMTATEVVTIYPEALLVISDFLDDQICAEVVREDDPNTNEEFLECYMNRMTCNLIIG